MKCPSCGHQQKSLIECERCGIIFAKYHKRQEQLANEKAALQEKTESKSSKGFSGLMVGLLIGLVAGGGAFYYFNKSTPQTTPLGMSRETAQTQATDNPVTQQREQPARQQARPPSRVPQQRENNLEGLAAQLSESHPANTAIERARNATVFVKTSWGSGSGFFVSSNGLIISNKHVLKMQAKDLDKLNEQAETGAKLLAREENNLRYLKGKVSQIHDRQMRQQLKETIYEREQEYAKYKNLHNELLEKITEIEMASPSEGIEVVLIDGSSYTVDSVTLSDDHDLALLSINTYAAPYIATSRGSRDQGQKVYTVGNPHGLRHTVTSGIISGYRNYNGKNLIQTDAPINPGNSGGPLIDEQGKVIGVNTMIIRGTEGIGFAIPMRTVFEEFGNYIPHQ